MMLSGCAKKELVKSEEPVVTSTPTPPPAKQPETAKPVSTETIATQPIKEIQPETAREGATAAGTDLSTLLDKVYFDFDSSTLTQQSRDTLSKDGSILLKNQPDLKVQIEGHCDERGSAEYNLALGERRAKSVMNYLVTLGVKASRLSTISYGKEKPADPGHDEAAWAKNRRAEFVAAK
jgi:peptidoglycan-associated lipoprotein